MPSLVDDSGLGHDGSILDVALWRAAVGYRVTDFGAVGDGSTDDTAAVQAAIDAADIPGAVAAIIVFPTGRTYKVTTLIVRGGRLLWLQGNAVILTSGGVQLRSRVANFGTPRILGTSMDDSEIRFTGASGSAILIQDTIIGAVFSAVVDEVKVTNTGSSADPMIDMVDGNSGLFRRVRVLDAPGAVSSYIFRLTRSINVVFDQVIVSGNITRSGILLRDDTDSISLRNCRINGSVVASSQGIVIDALNAVVQIDNTEHSRWAVGVQIGITASPNLTTIRDCYSEGCTEAFVQVGHSTDPLIIPTRTVIRRNYWYITGSAHYGVKAYGGSYLEVVGNHTPSGTFTGAQVSIGAAIADYKLEDNSAPAHPYDVAAGATSVRPSCRAYDSSGQTLAHDTLTTLTFGSETWDSGGIHSTSVATSRLTASKRGRYSLVATVGWLSNATGYRLIQAYKNGSALSNPSIVASQAAASGVQTWQTLTTELELGATDYIEIKGHQTSGGNLDIAGASAVLRMIEEWP